MKYNLYYRFVEHSIESFNRWELYGTYVDHVEAFEVEEVLHSHNYFDSGGAYTQTNFETIILLDDEQNPNMINEGALEGRIKAKYTKLATKSTQFCFFGYND